MFLRFCFSWRLSLWTAVSTTGQTAVTQTAEQTVDKVEKEEAAKKAEEIAKDLANQSADVAKAGLEGLKAGVDAAIKAYKENRNK